MADGLKFMLQRAVVDPFYLGSALATYARSEAIAWTDFTDRLGCPLESLSVLALCRRPQSDDSGFNDEIDLIAERFDIDADVLIEVIRRADVLDAWQEEAAGAITPGWLAAARDREIAESVRLYKIDLAGPPSPPPAPGVDEEEQE